MYNRLHNEFMAFHEKNPRVYEWFVRFANEALDAGRPRYSARTILHRLRWYTDIETDGDDFKINDHWSPFYSRMLAKEDERFSDFFEFRGAAADWAEETLFKETP